MKIVNKAILSVGIIVGGVLSAQKSDMNNMLKVGANVGLAVPASNFSAAVGVDVAYQNLITPGFGLGIATGYYHYFGKSNKGYDNNDAGLIPVGALLRIYPKKTGFYFGTDLGYAFQIGDDKVASNSNVDRPDGGFYIKPEIGYHNVNWNFFVQYQKVFTGTKGNLYGQEYNVSNLGIGFLYNIPLGK